MKIRIVQAILTIEGREKVMTKAIAKQFPFRGGDSRMVKAGQAKPGIAKVRGETLGRIADWLLLVLDPVAGFAWEPAVEYAPEYAEKMETSGYHVDHPERVPTIIL